MEGVNENIYMYEDVIMKPIILHTVKNNVLKINYPKHKDSFKFKIGLWQHTSEIGKD